MSTGIGTTTPYVFEFTPPEEIEEEIEYYDPFIINEDETVDMDLKGRARLRGKEFVPEEDEVEIFPEGRTLIVKGESSFTGNVLIEGEVVDIKGTLIINGVDVNALLGIGPFGTNIDGIPSLAS